MKIYEVFVCVPYCDPDYNEEYTRYNGTLFINKQDAEAYMSKMFADKEANNKFEPELPYGEEPKHRYITLSDYSETEMSWKDFCRCYWEMPKKKERKLRAIFETNFLVDNMKWHEAILLAVTYGGNRWYLREVELH